MGFNAYSDFRILWISTAQKVGVVILGGGVAGMAAAKNLIENNYTDFILLEAGDYLGGRVHTYREGNILVEDGAEWIHGGEKNPLYRLARKMNSVAHSLTREDYDWKVMTKDGNPSDPVKYKVLRLMETCMSEEVISQYQNDAYGQCYLDRFTHAYGTGAESDTGKAWLHLLEQIVNYEEGTDNWLESSAIDTGRYSNYGLDFQWKDGYDTLINSLKANLSDNLVRLSTPVCRITWNGIEQDKVLVETKGRQSAYLADHVLVTASVGHLKERHGHLFRPALPEKLIKDLSGIELGVADKVQMGWPAPWWGQKPIWIMILWTEFNLPVEMEWMYGIVQVMSVHQQESVLQVFVTGHHATAMESLSEHTVQRHLQSLLSNITNTEVPQPTFFRRSQWGLNPWTRGSYSSFVTVEGEKAGLDSRMSFQIPLENSKGNKVVLWAGEHTHNTHYSTVDGAMDSGLRAASEVLSLLKLTGLL
ncbi:peroxisomal N(1)-acetyl-spermine/spermidine oxidase-like isoform X2 [Palaemon carinicauda]|uniref:peroxisomal N(1)-acetyl-spermine/spermidine oxidase-like isoform X2 n=1 Tax=Palaemon carinicauda TaxID=392227 RepID=UPI0035B5ACFE